MLSTTKGVILHYTKFGESSLIATAYTEKFGRQSYLVNSAFGKNARNKASLLQPMFLVEMVVYHKHSREVQRLKEFRSSTSFQTIPFDIKKSAQTIFLAEILLKLLREEESNPELYHFIESSVLYLDQMEAGAANFHLFFLARLTQFLGIFPNISGKENTSWFDMEKGISSTTEPAHPMFMDKEQTSVFNSLANTTADELPKFSINRQLRKTLLVKIIEYYRQHFEQIGEIKSLQVLNEVYR